MVKPAAREPNAAPATEEVWGWLHEVPDPEIPVISVVDLGIVRDVQWADGTLIVTITPTYSGCPATQAIEAAIRAALEARGIESLRIETRLAPPWTTDWLSERGREALRAYGIAPPACRAIDASRISWRMREPAVSCPRCGSARTVRVSQFGSTPCKAHYRCEACLEPFDYFKPH